MSESHFKIPVGNPAKEKNVAGAGVKVIISAVFGLIVGVSVGTLFSWEFAPLAAWDGAGILFLAWTWQALHNRNAQQTADLATREDPGRAATDILLVLASIASIGAVIALLIQTNKANPSPAVVGVFSVAVSWAVVHTIYMLRYARLYFTNKGGINFNDTEAPTFSDFAYLSFTIGMTFQVSDSNIEHKTIRKTILHHALLSYLFGTVILAAMINLIVGLGK